MKTINIHGRPYVTVSERVKWFRSHDEFKDWAINTELTFNEFGVICRAEIVTKDDFIIAVGHAQEMPGSSTINKTSFVENCETSAVGRALAFLGIGIDGGIASLDEILSARQSEYIAKLLAKSAISDEDRDKIEKHLTTMTTSDAEAVIKFLLANQVDPIESGFGYNQGDIHKRLDEIDKDPKK